MGSVLCRQMRISWELEYWDNVQNEILRSRGVIPASQLG